PGDDQRSVGGESGCHHGCSCQPPVHVAAGDEVVVNAAPGAAAKPQPHNERDRQIGDDGSPVEKCEAHGRFPCLANFTMCTSPAAPAEPPPASPAASTVANW